MTAAPPAAIDGAVADRLAIGDLSVRYATALDDGDAETVVACFTADAVLESPVIGEIRGAAAIRAFADRFAAQRAARVQFRHMITNIAVALSPGRDAARATAYLLVAISENGAHRTLPPGRYDCDLVKADGAWRFSRRTVTHDHEYTLDGIRAVPGS
jgi:uncharacterized protein (TIGR02246 family)